MVEVHDVVMDILLGDHQVADQVGRFRDPDFKGILNRANGSKRMDRGAHSAGALGECPGLARVAAFQYCLYTPHHGT